MDPYYFLNLRTKLKDEEDKSFNLNELLIVYPDGTWYIDCEEYGHVTFRGVDYTEIYYSPTANQIVCKKRDITHVFKINIELV